jgi:hypothetical protein
MQTHWWKSVLMLVCFYNVYIYDNTFSVDADEDIDIVGNPQSLQTHKIDVVKKRRLDENISI